MPNKNYPRGYGDLKYYWELHCQKMKAKGETYVTYPAFINRLRKMELKDAIEYPRVDSQVRHRMYNRTPIQDNIRRIQVLKDEDIQILTFEEIEKAESFTKDPHLPPNTVITMAKYNMKPKKSWWSRFLDLFRR